MKRVFDFKGSLKKKKKYKRRIEDKNRFFQKTFGERFETPEEKEACAREDQRGKR